jgi:Asp-tRNA(Asn)/Glu-tRNA(Gln) amidotransferase A subunit family amidase
VLADHGDRASAVSVPAGLTAAGLPVGLQLVGRYGADRRLLEIAAAIMERASGPVSLGVSGI